MSRPTSTRRPKRPTLLEQAAEWRLLGLLFERPRPAWRADIVALSVEMPDAALREAAQAIASEATEGDYLALFGPGGAVSPRLVSHLPLADPGRLLAEITGFYEAFGYAPRREEPNDHIAIEIGFVAFLLLKEAFARARKEMAAARTTSRARQRFQEEYIAATAAGLAKGLALCNQSLWRNATQLLRARVPVKPAAVAPSEPLDAACGTCLGAD